MLFCSGHFLPKPWVLFIQPADWVLHSITLVRLVILVTYCRTAHRSNLDCQINASTGLLYSSPTNTTAMECSEVSTFALSLFLARAHLAGEHKTRSSYLWYGPDHAIAKAHHLHSAFSFEFGRLHVYCGHNSQPSVHSHWFNNRCMHYTCCQSHDGHLCTGASVCLKQTTCTARVFSVLSRIHVHLNVRNDLASFIQLLLSSWL